MNSRISDGGIHEEPVGGLHRLQRLDIAAIGGIEPGCRAGGGELGADIAAQVKVCRLPGPALRVAVDQGAEFAL